jgi:hypothetical protein
MAPGVVIASTGKLSRGFQPNLIRCSIFLKSGMRKPVADFY